LPQEYFFMKLKELVTSAPVLVLPDDGLLFWLEADGSGIATGAVLSQQSCDNNAWHPVTFLSKALNPVEHNYEIYDTEMLAIIQGLEEWWHYLEGMQHPIKIQTNHKNLEYFRVAQKLNWWQAKWSLYLSRFDFMLYHKPGWSMGKPIRMHCHSEQTMDQGKAAMTTLPFCHWHSSAFIHYNVHGLKAKSTTFSRRSDNVYDMTHKRNQ
jgi:hypothetical protein